MIVVLFQSALFFFAPFTVLTLLGSGSARNCRISAEVTDWQGRSVTQSVTVVVDAASTLNVPTATNTSAPVVLPLVFVRSGQQGSFIIYTPGALHARPPTPFPH